MQNKNSPKARGFTLLISIIAVTVLVTVGLGVSDLIIREVNLASVERESQRAFYNADTALECALYWDVKKPDLRTAGQFNITCAGLSAIIGTVDANLESTFDVNFSDNSCARINVDRDDLGIITTVTSRGYNESCLSTGLRKVERALRANYWTN